MINVQDVRELPSECGIYTFYKEEEPIYIGKAINCKARVVSHIQNSKYDLKENLIIKSTDRVSVKLTTSEFNALLLEALMIRKHEPKYNVRWKDDKSYIFVKVTVKDNYPKVFVVRHENDGKSIYFGPFQSQRTTLQLVRTLRRIIPFCQQKKISSKPCFYSKIGLCNPCPNTVSAKNDPRLRRVYRKNIRRIISILSGKWDNVANSLRRELDNTIRDERFEEGLRLRNSILSLQYLTQSRQFDEFDVSNLVRDTADYTLHINHFLKKHFSSNRITKNPRVECFDISNLGGKDASASMVVFENGVLKKDSYRRFMIRHTSKSSDTGMIEEVLQRRFANTKLRKPTLVVLDGGRPQIRAAKKILERGDVHIPIIGIAKKPDRLVIGGKRAKTLRFAPNAPFFRLLQQLRDESHRFAKNYHLHLRTKRLML